MKLCKHKDFDKQIKLIHQEKYLTACIAKKMKLNCFLAFLI